MLLLRTLFVAVAGLALAAAAQPPSWQDPIKTVSLPPSREQGLDMLLIDPDEMPQEPELAKDLPEIQEEGWSGAPIDLMKPVHHLYTDLRRQLVRYQTRWGRLPQVRVSVDGKLMKAGSTDPRVPILRERLGLAREGGFDEALTSRLKEFQQAHGVKADGAAGADTLEALNRGSAHYERLILLSMERARRLPAPGGADKYVLVDAGSARLWMYENGRPVDSMKVIVGTPKSETPMLAALIRYADVNPYWNIPWDLVETLIAPRVVAEGTSYLTDRGYQVLESWEDDAKLVDPETVDWRAAAAGKLDLRMRQLPGPANSMGEIKFMMPNEFGIYLHDTPNKTLFDQEDRWLSNGCVRVEDARRLARWIFGDMPKGKDPRVEERVELEKPVPVYITYLTVAAGPTGLAFRPDPYERNAAVLARFDADGDGMSDAEEVALASAEQKPEPAEKKIDPPAKKAAPAPANAKPVPVVAAKSAPEGPKPAKTAAKEPAKAAPKAAAAAKEAPRGAEPEKVAAKQPVKGTPKAVAAKTPTKPSKPAAKAGAAMKTASTKASAAKTAAARTDSAAKTGPKTAEAKKGPSTKAAPTKAEAKPAAAKTGTKPSSLGAKASSAR